MSGSSDHIIGRDGPVLVMSGRTCAILWPLMSRAAAELETHAPTKLRLVAAELAAWKQVAEAYDRHRARFVDAPHDAGRHNGPDAGPKTTDKDTTTMTTNEAAARLGCTAKHVRTLARRGDLDARRHGTAWLIDRAAVERLAA